MTTPLVLKVSAWTVIIRLSPSSLRSLGRKGLTAPDVLYPKNEVSRVMAFLLLSKAPKYPLAVSLLKAETANLH